MKLVLATANPGKLLEFQQLTPDAIDLLPLSDFSTEQADETAPTFIENALLKARFAAEKSNLPALADDSGLSVDALQGAPGIYSARYSSMQDDVDYQYNKKLSQDQNNNLKLLKALEGSNRSQRSASFYCALVYIRHAQDPSPIIALGRWQGSICKMASGDNGFGYDPLFWIADENCTSAQLSKAQKSTISHRGLAMQSLLQQLNLSQFEGSV